jgi:hypothetical protein
MPPDPPKPPKDDEEPIRTIFEWERMRARLDEPLGGGGPAGPTYPRLPASSPWSVGIDQASGREPSVDRSEDGPTTIGE